MIEQLQDEQLAKADLRDQEHLAEERMAWEGLYQEVDRLYPDGAGGFNKSSPGAPRHDHLFDTTHLTALERFRAAGVAITTPEEVQYIRPRFLDDALNKQRSVQLWNEQAGKRLYGIRHALHSGFITAAGEDWDQLGRYGTSPMWADMHPTGRGMFYRTLHLSECFIDTDFSGLVNRVHRLMCRTAAQWCELFGMAALTPKMVKAIEENKPHTEFEVLHVVCPNTDWDKEKIDWRQFPIGSRYLAMDEKIYLQRKGFHSMPVSVSRHMTSPGEKYGRSPAIKMMPNAKGLQAMRKIVLRAANKAVDPALLFFADNGVTKLVTKPGGLNAGLMSEEGRPLVSRMPGGEQGLPFAENEAEYERGVIKTAFLEEFFKLLTDPNGRMTTVEVVEVLAKQGVLVRPFASRYASEKQHPVSQRELDLCMRNGQLPELPPEVLEAGAWPLVEYENPLSAMARAESTGKTMRWLEMLNPLMQVDPTVRDYIDTDEMVAGSAIEIGVNPLYVRDGAAVAALRAQRKESEQAPIEADAIAKLAGAGLDTAKANQISAAA